MVIDPFDIDDCRDAPSIRERLKYLDRMSGYAFDAADRIRDTKKRLKDRLASLGEEA